MMAKSITLTVLMSEWLQDMVFASAQLLAAVEDADAVLVTDEIQEAASELRRVLERNDA